jgi:membrane protein
MKNNRDSNASPGFSKHLYLIAISLKRAFKELTLHDPLLLSSSVAFFTLFSLPPILIILTNLFGAIFKSEDIGKKLYNTLSASFGENSANQINKIIHNIQDLGNYPLITIVGTVLLIFIGTTTFSIIHKALNQIWQVKEKPKNNLVYFLKERGIALIIIFLSGLLFLASLMTEVVITFFKRWSIEKFPVAIAIINETISIVIVTIWFAIIFKALPNVKLKWSLVWVGAFVTGVLFDIGKFLLGILLVGSNLKTVYGTASSIILVLLFLFYSSLILFYGASFTKVYATLLHHKIEPRSYSVAYEINELGEKSE